MVINDSSYADRRTPSPGYDSMRSMGEEHDTLLDTFHVCQDGENNSGLRFGRMQHLERACILLISVLHRFKHLSARIHAENTGRTRSTPSIVPIIEESGVHFPGISHFVAFLFGENA